MRMLLIFAIIGGIIYFSYNAITTGHGVFSSVGGGTKLENALQHPTKMFSHKDKVPEAAASADAPAPASPEPVGLASVSTTASTLGQSQGVIAPVPVPMMSGMYAFKHREPPEMSAMPALAALGAQVISDKSSRMVFVRAPEDVLPTVLSFLQSIDLVGGSCAVQTWAVYVDRSAVKGFDLVAAIGAIVPAMTTATVGDGAFTLNLAAGDVSAALAVIADGSSVEVLQRPHVRLSHGVQSRIESTQEVPIPQSTLSNGISQTSIVYRKVGLQLEVTPYFLGNEAVRLQVKQTNGLIGNNVVIEGNQIPVIQSQSVETTAELTVGQTVILGGVSTQRVKVNRGFLRNTQETTEGALYVILSTYEDVPKALPVGLPPIDSPSSIPVPLSTPLQDPRDWIDGQLLPVKGWQNEERDFVRARSAK